MTSISSGGNTPKDNIPVKKNIPAPETPSPEKAPLTSSTEQAAKNANLPTSQVGDSVGKLFMSLQNQADLNKLQFVSPQLAAKAFIPAPPPQNIPDDSFLIGGQAPFISDALTPINKGIQNLIPLDYNLSYGRVAKNPDGVQTSAGLKEGGNKLGVVTSTDGSKVDFSVNAAPRFLDGNITRSFEGAISFPNGLKGKVTAQNGIIQYQPPSGPPITLSLDNPVIPIAPGIVLSVKNRAGKIQSETIGSNQIKYNNPELSAELLISSPNAAPLSVTFAYRGYGSNDLTVPFQNPFPNPASFAGLSADARANLDDGYDINFFRASNTPIPPPVPPIPPIDPPPPQLPPTPPPPNPIPDPVPPQLPPTPRPPRPGPGARPRPPPAPPRPPD
ncbi:MAG: hypothetical protein K2X66_13430, partial [Cyanobacteria bacterium]|nr:hypothetical protein [Cyanobacteriota bacterium]